MKHPVLLIAILVAAPIAARGQSFKAAYLYDAAANKTCAITARQYDTLRDGATSAASVDSLLRTCPSSPARFEDTMGVPLLVIHGRFGAKYNQISCTATELSSGILEPRGLADVTPLTLSTLGTLVPHGGRLPSTITVAALTPTDLIAQLIDPAQMTRPQTTLDAQRADLDAARSTLERQEHELLSNVNRVALDTDASCDAVSGAPSIRSLTRCVGRLESRMIDMTWDRDTFDATRREIDGRVADLNVLKDMLAGYAFTAALDQYENESAQFTARLQTYRQNLETVKAVVENFVEADGKHLKSEFKDALTELQRAEVRRQFDARYGKILEAVELNELTAAQAKALAASGLLIGKTAGTMRANAIRGLNDTGLKVETRAVAQASVRTALTGLVSAVDTLNQQFARVFNTMNDAYLHHPDDELSGPYPIETTTLAGKNRDVYCAITPVETFALYRFTPGAALARSSGAQAVVLPGSNPPPVPPATASAAAAREGRFGFELHKRYRANIVGGFVFSSLRKTTYGVTSKDGHVVPTLTDDQRPVPYYLVGFNLYLKPRDTFWRSGTRPADWMPGVMFGIGVANSKHFFVGPNFEPTLGLDLSFGLHYGEQQALNRGVVAETSALPDGTTAAPTRSVMKPAVYGMFGFDLNLFRRFLGVLAPAAAK